MIIVPDAAALTDSITAKVVKVFDGDGFLATLWHPIRCEWVSRIPFRFAFIDAPEMAQPLGLEARNFLENLILKKSLQVTLIGKESNGYMPIDQYKRMLCMGFLSEEMPVGPLTYYQNGFCGSGTVRTARSVVRNVELEMVVNGWAWVVEQYTFEREDEYFQAQEDAQRNGRGIWGLENPEPPWNFKRRQKRRRKSAEPHHDLFSAASKRAREE